MDKNVFLDSVEGVTISPSANRYFSDYPKKKKRKKNGIDVYEIGDEELDLSTPQRLEEIPDAGNRGNKK